MIRKVIQHGPSTLVVSLPAKWVRKQGVKKGDELMLLEEGKSLLVSAEQKKNARFSITIQANELSKMLPRYIHALYKKGLDVIHIQFSNEEQFALIRQAISKETVGLELIDSSKNRCTIKIVATLNEEYASIMRQMFLTTLRFAEETVMALEQQQYAQLQSLLALEESNNKFANMLRRYLNVHQAKMTIEAGPLYSIADNIEAIADEYKFLNKKFSNRIGGELSSELLSYYKKINSALRLFYECYYKKDIRKILQMHNLRKDVLEGLLAVNYVNTDTQTLVHHAIVLMTLVFALVEPLIIISEKSEQSIDLLHND